MTVIDLKSTVPATAGKINTVVSFKEARNGNIILCSGGIYIYTMRASPSELRIVNVANSNSRELFKGHTSIPTVAKIVNVGIKQHMVASGSDSELLVWSYQSQALNTFFKWPNVKVFALEWVKGHDATPSLVILYSKDGGARKLGVLNTKKVMERYSKLGLDGQTVEVTPEDVNEPLLAVDGSGLLAAGVFGDVKGIAVANTSTNVVDIVFSDNTTSKILLPDGEKIVSIFINNDFQLIVAGANGSVFVYSLRIKSSEYVPVLQAKLPSAPSSSASLGNIVSFIADKTVFSLQITADGALGKAVTISESVQGFALVEDNGAFRGAFDTEKFLLTGVVFDKTATAIPLETAKTPLASAPPAYISASPVSRAAQPTVSLKNSTLVSAAAPASITAAQSAAASEVDSAIEDLRSHIASTQDAIVNYATKTQKMDLEAVIQHALEAQMVELLKLRIASAVPVSSGIATSAVDLDDSYIVSFRNNLANNISVGIVEAIDQVSESVAAKIRESSKKTTKKTGSDTLKRRLDDLVGEVNTTFTNAFSDRMKQGESNFKNSVAQLNRANDEVVRTLQQQVDDLNAQLRAVASSGIIEEVKRLRKEVAQLKGRIGSQPQSAPVSPDTLIQTAIATIDSGNVVGGFEYAVATGQPGVVASVLIGVKDRVFESSTMSNELWSHVLTLGAIGAQNKEEAIAVLNAAEVVKDDETILSANAGKARVALKAFYGKWKATFASEAPLRNQLKSLDIELGSK